MLEIYVNDKLRRVINGAKVPALCKIPKAQEVEAAREFIGRLKPSDRYETFSEEGYVERLSRRNPS